MAKREIWVYSLVIMCVILLHGTGYRYGLPYVEHYDEARIFYNAAIQRGAADGVVDLPGYPPALMWMHDVVQPISEQITHRPAELEMGVGIGMLRGLAVLCNALSAALLVWCGRRITGAWAIGLLAAAAWATAPDTLYNTVIALTEPYLILTSLLALALALAALYNKSQKAAVLSIVAALIGVMFKYSAFPALGFGVGVALWHLREDRRWFRVLVVQAALIMGAALFLFSVGGAGTLLGWSTESQTFTQGGFARLADAGWWHSIGEPAANQLRLSIPALLGLVVAGTAAFVLLHDQTRRLIWFSLLFFTLSMLAFTIMYIVYTEGVYRYVAPSSPFLALLASLAIWGIGTVILQGRDTPKRDAKPISTFVFAFIAVIWTVLILPTSLGIVQDRARPDTRAALADWSLPILTTPYQTILQDSRDVRPFVRDRAGYRGLWHSQRWEDPLEQLPAAWRAEGANWLMATEETQERLMQTDEGRAWAAEALFLKSFPPEGERWRGPALWFYRLTPPMTAVDVVWGETVHLVGYDVLKNDSAWPDNSDMQAGDTLTFAGYWRATTTPPADLHLFIHVRPADDLTQVVAQVDGLPVDMRPTTTWDDTQETLIGTAYSLIWPDLPTGDYVLIIGLYDLATGVRWLTTEGSDGWSMMPIHSK